MQIFLRENSSKNQSSKNVDYMQIFQYEVGENWTHHHNYSFWYYWMMCYAPTYTAEEAMNYNDTKQIVDAANAQRMIEATLPKMVPLLIAIWLVNVVADMSIKRMFMNIMTIMLNGLLLLLFFDALAWIIDII